MDILINLLVAKYQIWYIIMIRDLYAALFWNMLQKLDYKDMYVYFSLSPTISYLFLPHNLTKYCYDANTNDILHTIIMNYRNRFRQHFESDTVWEHYFEGYPALMLDRCYKKEGYNLLHKVVNRYKDINKDKSNYFQFMSSDISFSDLTKTLITNIQVWCTA
jgi:hypothetical protein